MHIPDGYLSPASCTALYGASTPFWYLAIRKLKHIWRTQTLPLLSVFAAFSFVLMMFNLPLPGGTTGHAVGVGIAAIILGPWGGMLAVSLALAVQAIFFGDGGVTTFGANCFNMAIAGSLAAYGIYRVLAGRAPLSSTRRVFAGGVAAYMAINLSALCAAIEFGIQPVLFHDASGTPLYAPYPLSIAVPAMMVGHLTFAGLAELVVTAGILRYLQSADPALLRLTAPHALETESSPAVANVVVRARMRRFWLALACILVLTPFGIMAVGSAWGEWTPDHFSSAAVRQQLAAASRGALPPENVPRGLERLSSLWTAPMPRYAPAFIHNASFGYAVSAAIGMAIIILLFVVLNSLLWRFSRRRNAGFLERTTTALLNVVERSLFAEKIARSGGLLQRFDPRVKIAGFSGLVLAALLSHRLPVLAGLLVWMLVLALVSRVSFLLLVGRVWLGVLAFTGFIAFPAIFLIPGETVCRLPLLEWPIYRQGLHSALFLILRAEVVTTVSVLLVLTTRWAQVLKALHFFRVPMICVVLLGTTYRYIFLLIQTASEMFEARRARLVGSLDARESRRLAARTGGVLLAKSFHLSHEVHLAMMARGFRGEIYTLDAPPLETKDWAGLCILVAIAALALWAGR